MALTLTVGVADSFRMLVSTYKTIVFHISQDQFIPNLGYEPGHLGVCEKKIE
jgi:hypothetical protein